MVGSANFDADETRRQPTQQAEPAEYSKYCRSSRYTFWKAVADGFVILFQESWLIKT